MTTAIHCATCDANKTSLVQIESSFARGHPGLQLVGNATEVCRDGRERARTALEALGIHLPPQRLIVSLTPADVRKDGSQFDLAMAVSLALLICNRKAAIETKNWLFAAELSLSGDLRPVKGVVSFALEAIARGLEGIVVAEDSVKDLQAIMQLRIANFDQLKIVGLHSLGAVLAWVFEKDAYRILQQPLLGELNDEVEPSLPNFDDMVLSDQLRKLAVVVAAGEHSLLLRGTPGCGKSMFARRLRSILPTMSREHHLEVLKLYSGFYKSIPNALLAGSPPMRHPHHQASAAAVLGTHERPGELSLSHGGVLFLDELPEFRRDILEGLREPLENGEVSVSRSKEKVVWKSEVQLIAACNNCPCGWLGSPMKKCRCDLGRIKSYKEKLSGPVLDRIDIHFNMPEAIASSSHMIKILNSDHLQGQSARLKERVSRSKEFARIRHQKLGIHANRAIAPRDMLFASGLNEDSFIRLLEALPQDQHVTKRTLFRGLRVARTIADSEESTKITADHLALAWSWSAESSARERGEHLMGL